ncbi:hypothetical protein D3874_24435 [Oleomonas cavernae]|uniref:Antitoxin of toxin-antitoxin stability system n=1 Tax=Oleomonas cavernae TaxID=2320859 RepID=A0A418WK17_9PROT|nr:hypothetical protein [Oleomonas cavernae]RJF90169.1 hypothetical protein D3874_24435 [Oleomonas cavernae]
MAETTFTFRVDEALKAEFVEAAKAHDRPASILLRDFMRDYIKQSRDSAEHDRWFRAEVEQGLREADRADAVFHDAETVFQELGKRRAPRRP